MPFGQDHRYALVSFDSRSSQTRVPHNDANFGIGTRGCLVWAGLPIVRATLVIAAIASAIGGSALAANAPPPVPIWEGFYLGTDLGSGMGVGQVSPEAVPGLSAFDFLSGQGFVGGLLAGYNHMIAPRWLIGIEGDVSFPDITSRINVEEAAFDLLDLSVEQKRPEYSLRTRLGYLVTPGTLLYGTAGWTWSDFTRTLSVPTDAFFETDNVWFDGPQLGAGIETMIAPGWIARLEYLYSLYGAQTLSTTTALGPMRPDVAVGRVALIHNFGGSDPAPWDGASVQPSWNGFYLGGALGAGVGNAKVEFPAFPGTEIDGVGTPGVFPAILAGHNWHVARQWVLGAEGELEPGLSTADIRLDWTAALRGRVGYLLTPATMLYGTAGWLTTGFKTTSEFDNIVQIPGQRVNAAEIGGGIETALTDHWAARFEYQYAFAGDINGDVILTAAGFGSTSEPFTGHLQMQYAKLGLVYMFGTY